MRWGWGGMGGQVLSAPTSIRGCSGVPLVCKSAALGAPKTWWGAWDLGWGFPILACAHTGSVGVGLKDPPGDPNSHFGGCFGADLVKIGKMHHRDPTNTSPTTFGTPKYPIPSAKIPPTPNPKKPHGAKVAPFAAPGGGLGVRAACWGCLVGSSGVPRHAVGARCGHGVCTPLPHGYQPTTT